MKDFSSLIKLAFLKNFSNCPICNTVTVYFAFVLKACLRLLFRSFGPARKYAINIRRDASQRQQLIFFAGLRALFVWLHVLCCLSGLGGSPIADVALHSMRSTALARHDQPVNNTRSVLHFWFVKKFHKNATIHFNCGNFHEMLPDFLVFLKFYSYVLPET